MKRGPRGLASIEMTLMLLAMTVMWALQPALVGLDDAADGLEKSRALSQIGVALHGYHDATDMLGDDAIRFVAESWRSGVVDPEAVRKLHGELEQRRLELEQARADLERFSESDLSARDIKLRKAGLDAIEATSDAIDLMEGGLIGLL